MSGGTIQLDGGVIDGNEPVITGSIERILASPLRRIHIVGGPGSGKTSLAVEVGVLTGLPVHHLDDVVRQGGGDGPLRELDERDLLLAQILDADGWVTEGVHLGWTDTLFQDAELVIWLDYVTWSRATRRIVRRFVGGAVHEMRARPMRERFTRFGDYAHHLHRLGAVLVESRRYYRMSDRSGDSTRTEPAPDPVAGEPQPGGAGSWSMTAGAIAAYQQKLVHCRKPDDVYEVLRRLR